MATLQRLFLIYVRLSDEGYETSPLIQWRTLQSVGPADLRYSIWEL
jgi:hypothetical protein